MVAEFLLTSASRGPSAIAEPLVISTMKDSFEVCDGSHNFMSSGKESVLFLMTRLT